MANLIKNLFFLSVVISAYTPCLKASLPDDTVITSNCLEMQATPQGHIFYFSGNVHVQSKELVVQCDTLEAKTQHTEQKDDKKSTPSPYNVGAVETITAKGHVLIIQGNRQAKAGQADIYAKEGKIILSDNPVVTDPEGSLEGYKIILIQGEERIYVEGAPDCTATQRPRVVLPSLPGIKTTTDSSTNISKTINEPAAPIAQVDLVDTTPEQKSSEPL